MISVKKIGKKYNGTVKKAPKAKEKVKVGEHYWYHPLSFSTMTDKGVPQQGDTIRRGKVLWVHPKGRFHVVGFETPRGVVRESFPGVEA